MTATEIYESVSNGGASNFAEVAAILDRNGPWCLLGGLAVNCYVEPVYTMDADFVAVTRNSDAIRTGLKAAGFVVEAIPREITSQLSDQDALS